MVFVNNPPIDGPVGTVWKTDFSEQRVYVDVTLEKEDAEYRTYSWPDNYLNRKVRKKDQKRFVFGGPYNGRWLTDTDMRILDLRDRHVLYTRADSTLASKLAVQAPPSVWLHADMVAHLQDKDS